MFIYKLCFIVSPIEPYQPHTTLCPKQTSQFSLETTPVISLEEDDDNLIFHQDNVLTTLDSEPMIGDLINTTSISKYIDTDFLFGRTKGI